jgi:hypothetical protein
MKLYVRRYSDDWIVQEEGNDTPLYTADTRQSAVQYGEKLAEARQVELVVYGEDDEDQEYEPRTWRFD